MPQRADNNSFLLLALNSLRAMRQESVEKKPWQFITLRFSSDDAPNNTSHCDYLYALRILEIDGTREAYFRGEAKNLDAFWGSISWAIGSMFWYCHWSRPGSRWHVRVWQSCCFISEVACPVLAWWQCVLPATHWSMEARQSLQGEDSPDGQAMHAATPSPHLKATSAAEVGGMFDFSAAPCARQAIDCCLKDWL